MAEFELVFFSVSTTGQLQVTGDTPTKVFIQSRRLEVKSTVSAQLVTGEKYYVGFIQVCYRNSQVNHYEAGVEQKWEFGQALVSDSADRDERPWYGSFTEPNTAGFRRRILYPTRKAQKLKFSMTDDFAPGIVKRETLANNQLGPHRLTQIIRDQRFRLWLVAVPTSVNPAAQDSPGKYIRMAEVDWRYQYDIGNGGQPLSFAAHIINTDSLTTKIVYNSHGAGVLSAPSHGGGNMIPHLAMTAPIANDNQQLTWYQGNNSHVIVPRIP
jgi:hypothetical protein